MDIFVARQPIFDRQSRVHGYELLYRSNASFNEFAGADEDGTTLDVLAGSLLNFGLTGIAAGKRAFINFGHNLLVEGLASIVPKEGVVIEVLETAEPDAALVKSCRKLRDLGYTIALDDFQWHPRFDALIEVANIIKVDLRLTSPEEQERLVTTYRPRGIEMLAEKVETLEEFHRAVNLGFDYFQGYFFARPDILSGREIQPAVVLCLQLLRELQSPEIDFRKIEEFIAKDVSLAYKLFRYVKSAMFERQEPCKSIRAALVRLGEDGVRRWVTIATLPRIANNKPEELVTCSLVRARFCESLAKLAGDPGFTSAYLVGLFSLLDALLDQPMDAALDELGLASPMKDVLLGTANPGAVLTRIYALVRCYEAGRWEDVSREVRCLGLADSDVASAYVAATSWTAEILQGREASDSKPKDAPRPAAVKARKKERRRGTRDALAAQVTVLWGSRPEEEQIAQANLVDVSVLGARFRLPNPVPVGSWLMFSYHKIQIGGRGTVRYCCRMSGVYEVGVEFAGGTGWDSAVQRMNKSMRGLSAAVERLQSHGASPESPEPAKVRESRD